MIRYLVSLAIIFDNTNGIKVAKNRPLVIFRSFINGRENGQGYNLLDLSVMILNLRELPGIRAEVA